MESPAKARTIAGYLGKGYVVESSIGHIRDMPDKAAEIPQKYRGEPWARLGVDVDNDFQALYVVPGDKKQQVSKLKTLLKDADELYLATDEDREGEAIAWHLLEELKPKVPARRMVFHEITPEAIARAIANPTELNHGKVDAYQTRRVLDRLYGYEVSPVLWKKVMPRLSAGRVQSVATRLIVDRERERIAFRSASYWDLEAEFATAEHGKERLPDSPTSFTATLLTVDGTRVAQGRDFTPQRLNCAAADVLHLDGAGAAALAARLRDDAASFRVSRSSASRTAARRTRRSAPPRCSRRPPASSGSPPSTRCRWRSGCTRTATSPICGPTRSSSRRPRSTPPASRPASSTAPSTCRTRRATYASKVKNAQEAHEAIRPAGDRFRTPAEGPAVRPQGRRAAAVRPDLEAHGRLPDEGRDRRVGLGPRRGHPGPPGPEIIDSERTGAPAERLRPSTRRRCAGPSSAPPARSSTSTGSSRPTSSPPTTPRTPDDQERRLPALAERQPLSALRVDAAEHATRPPARYTEASLVKELEDREIGRPSTYATHHRHDPRPRLRVQEGHRARALLPGVRRGHAARAALRAARRLRVHRADGGRARRDRPRRGGTGAVAAPLLLRRRRPGTVRRHGNPNPFRRRLD